MASAFLQRGQTTPILLLDRTELRRWLGQQNVTTRRWVENAGFTAKPGSHCLLPGRGGELKAVLAGKRDSGPLYQLSSLYKGLPKGGYHIAPENQDELLPAELEQLFLGWGLAAYRFNRYKRQSAGKARLLLPKALKPAVSALTDAQYLVRDWVNTPTEDFGPDELAAAVVQQAESFGADVGIVRGDELLTQNFPAVHAVGRACTRPPQLIHLSWGDEDRPGLSLVGKGVCFDTGGLDIKSAVGMLKMKKDMGGAAHVMAIARLVMQFQFPVRLNLFIPAVENSIAGNAYRPGDVIPTRRGKTVEIGNTDAEGRVILSDALTRACEDNPELLLDFATLTGAARVALGTDLPALFSNDDEVAGGLLAAGEQVEDPLWQLPLHQPYRRLIASKIADLANVAKSGFGGAITAALFLQHFVGRQIPWVHVDTYAWNDADRSGRPSGGEALGMRAVFHYLRARYR